MTIKISSFHLCVNWLENVNYFPEKEAVQIIDTQSFIDGCTLQLQLQYIMK